MQTITRNMVERNIAKGKPTCIIGKLTPDAAKFLLETDPKHQRRIRDSWVSELESEVKNGRWGFNGEAIKITSKGEMADGQHRCLCVLRTNTDLPTVLVFGVDVDAINTIDRGIVRTLADNYQVKYGRDSKYAMEISTAIRNIILVKDGTHASHRLKVKPYHIEEFIEDNPTFPEFVEKEMRAFQRSDMIINKTPYLASKWIILENEPNVDLVDEFFEQLLTGQRIERGMVTYALRKKLIRIKANQYNRKLGVEAPRPWWFINAVIHAWNKFVDEEQCFVLKFPDFKGQAPSIKTASEYVDGIEV